MKAMEAQLANKNFMSVHRSYIVNLNKIKEYLKTEGYVIMESNHKIPVARQRKSDFLEKL